MYDSDRAGVIRYYNGDPLYDSYIQADVPLPSGSFKIGASQEDRDAASRDEAPSVEAPRYSFESIRTMFTLFLVCQSEPALL